MNYRTSLLTSGGEFYILRLHPNSLLSTFNFSSYKLQPKSEWTDGDTLKVRLIHKNGQVMDIVDTYWNPKTIAAIFEARGCKVELLDVTSMRDSITRDYLTEILAHTALSPEDNEWKVPLYQIIRVTKH